MHQFAAGVESNHPFKQLPSLYFVHLPSVITKLSAVGSTCLLRLVHVDKLLIG